MYFIITSGDTETFEPVLDPASAEIKGIYLVQNEDVFGKEQYYEWLATENNDTKEWTCVGEISIDLRDIKVKEIKNKIADIKNAAENWEA